MPSEFLEQKLAGLPHKAEGGYEIERRTLELLIIHESHKKRSSLELPFHVRVVVDVRVGLTHFCDKQIREKDYYNKVIKKNYEFSHFLRRNSCLFSLMNYYIFYL